MDFSSLRRLTIVSMFSDDDLMEMLVLKGGNALGLVHRIGSRSSLDLDFSMADDFPDLEWARERLIRSLEDRFDSAGYLVFDAKLTRKPQRRTGRPPHWGGYRLEFKIIGKDRARELGHDLEQMRQAVASIPVQHRRLEM